MNKLLILAAAATMILLSLSYTGCGSSAKTADNPEQEEDPGALLFDGQAKAEVNCASCHDPSSGGTAPDLAQSVGTLSDEEIMDIMVQGRGNMPSFADALAEQERQQILKCLRARFNANTQQ